ncbi:hypothetical protein ACJX0J_039972, partial [Zea mays]
MAYFVLIRLFTIFSLDLQITLTLASNTCVMLMHESEGEPAERTIPILGQKNLKKTVKIINKFAKLQSETCKKQALHPFDENGTSSMQEVSCIMFLIGSSKLS